MGQSTPFKPPLVLVVEDDALIRLELAAELADMGLTMVEADSADEAIAMMDANPTIKILLTDIKMAGSMDGIRLAHHARDLWPPMKIIVASGILGTRFSDLPPGAILVTKPYRPQEIQLALAYLMGRNHAQPTDRTSVGPV